MRPLAPAKKIKKCKYFVSTGLSQICQIVSDEIYYKEVDADFHDLSPAQLPFRLITQEFSEIQGMLYVAGYLSHKFRSEFPQFGQHSPTLSDHELEKLPWPMILSRGGLCVPTPSFLSEVGKLESVLNAYNGIQSLSREKHVLKNRTKHMVSQFTQLPKKIVTLFVKTRFLI